VVKFVKIFAMTFAFALLLPTLGASKALAEGKVAVLDTQAAILGTDEAQKRLKAMRDKPEFKANQAELEKLKKEYNDLLEQVKKEIAVMSPEQKDAQGKKIEAKRGDIEHVVRKLQAAEQELGQSLMQDMGPKLQKAVADVIKNEGIGLLLDRRAALHADATYNITPKVTDLLNKGGQ
jgi:outer membrane protein